MGLISESSGWLLSVPRCSRGDLMRRALKHREDAPRWHFEAFGVGEGCPMQQWRAILTDRADRHVDIHHAP